MNSIQSLSHSKRRHKYYIGMPDAARDWYIKRNFQAELGICLRIARRPSSAYERELIIVCFGGILYKEEYR